MRSAFASKVLLVAALIVGLAPACAHAATKYKTKITFNVAAGSNYSRYWSLDTTSVAPIYAKARLMYYRPSSRRWVGYPRRPVTIVRGSSSSGFPLVYAKATTDANGYFSVKMSYADKYLAKYYGAWNAYPCSATSSRVDNVEMRRSTTVSEEAVDELNSRLTIVTDYQYNPYVAQANRHVSLWSSLSMFSPTGDEDFVHIGENDLIERPLTGIGRSVVSVVMPEGIFKDRHRRFVSKVKYPGRYMFVSSGDVDQPVGESMGPRPPVTLWRPSAESVPASGTYVFLDSDPTDYIGGGQQYLYVSPGTDISVSSEGARLCVDIGGGTWAGDFRLPDSFSRIAPGFYNGLTRSGFHNPLVGGISWSGFGRGDQTPEGWLVVDRSTYVRGVLTELDARFEQHTAWNPAAVRGAIHWVSENPPLPPGPLNPVPDTLWRPPMESMPETSAYVYLDSGYYDQIGEGLKYSYTRADGIALNQEGNVLSVGVAGWGGAFALPSTATRFEPGYYGYLRRYPFHDPAQGGLNWGGYGRGASELSGWFVVDSSTYVDGKLAAIDLRFEQFAGVNPSPLNGYIHWVAE